MIRIATLSWHARCGAPAKRHLAATTRQLARRSSAPRSGTAQITMTTFTTTRRQKSTTVVVSRRQWNEYLQKSAPKLKASETATTAKPDEKPWPRSILWTGYFLAATLIPYTAVWICLTNESTRPLVLDHCGPWLEGILREHFGQKDVDDVSYVDRREGGLPFPKKFLGELPQSIREQQRRIDEDSQTPLRVRLQLRSTPDSGPTAEAEVQVPATEKANKETLVTRLSSVDKSTASTSALVVDFPSETGQNLDTFMQDDDDEQQQQEDVMETIDPLREEARVYSLWHFQPPSPPATAAAAPSGSTMSRDDIDMARLRQEIAVLQQELKHSTATTRAIDDIEEDLQRRKAALRRLQWKRWLPWS